MSPIAAIGITNQRETTVLWERATGRPVHNAIVWQDRRTAALCESWRAAGLTETVAARTGLVIDPYFSASKVRWLLDATPGLRQRAASGEIAFGTIDAFLLWRLTGGRLHATDVTNASRTMLFDLHRLAWDDELLDAFDIPRALLPELRDTGDDFGNTAAGLFGDAIPIAGVAGDQQAALIGQACFRPGMVKSTYGTGAFALLHTGAAPAVSHHRLVTTLAYRLGGETAYALEGSIFIAGAAVQWLRDRLRAVAAAPETQALAERADPRQRLVFRAGFCRARGATLVARGARRADRADRRVRVARNRASDARSGRLPDARPRRGDGVGWRGRDRQACGSMAGSRRAIGRCSSSPTFCRHGSSARPRWKRRPGAPPTPPG